MDQPPHTAVFLDRDGTIIEEKNYLKNPEDVILVPGAADALRPLSQAGFRLVIVTNQSGVGRGLFTLQEAEAVNLRVSELFGAQGVSFDRVCLAPEAPGQPSRGRKPSPQFLFDARDELGVDLTRSFMIGDKLADLECGWNAGVQESILVRTGYGRETEKQLGDRRGRSVIVDDMPAAAEWILRSRQGAARTDT